MAICNQQTIDHKSIWYFSGIDHYTMSKQKPSAPKSSNKKIKSTGNNWVIYAILFVSLLAYLPIFNAGFVQWDDKLYIQDNGLIRSIDLPKLFSTYEQGNYHPLTMLVYSIEYQLWGLNASGYHVVNLLFHLLNAFLVFIVVRKISSRQEVALVASLLFGIHPIHVESVAWLAELKDVMYTFFFLLSYRFYLSFSKNANTKEYVLALLFFLCSLLSKGMAASLPVLLVLTDYFLDGKFSRKKLLATIPFFVLSVIFGLIAIVAQRPSGLTTGTPVFPVGQRIIFASYGFIMYLFKIVLPIDLNAIYPYPIKVGEALPASFYIFPLLVITVIAAVVYSLRRTKKILYGLGFFAITVFLVLQLLPVGDAIMADRYAYLPSIGIFYLAAEATFTRRNGNAINPSVVKGQAWIALSIFAIFFFSQTYSYCKIWKDGMTLWTDVIKKDSSIAGAYNNRGLVYIDQGNISLAKKDFDDAIRLQPDFAYAYYNRGLTYMQTGNAEAELSDYTKAISLRANYTEAYVNRGIAFYNRKKYDQSLKDYSKALELRPDQQQALMGRGTVLFEMKRYDEALTDFEKVRSMQENNPDAWYNQGLAQVETNKLAEAIRSFSQTILLKPDYAAAYYQRGKAEVISGQVEAGCSDFKLAYQNGYPAAPDEYNKKCY
jgi:tetratricopeptide (TPR) repeat protein